MLARDPLDVVLVGTYPPTECGLATYTANLRGALAGAGTRARVVRVLDAPSGAERDCDDPDVATIWRHGDPSGLEVAADTLNGSEVVLIQHEFGIFAGADGESVLDLAQRCDRPIITVLHTVMENPTPRQEAIVTALAGRSSRLVVHSAAARSRLLGSHALDPAIVRVIPHGAAPNRLGCKAVTCTEPLLLTWGLLGPGKGIEHGIEAIALLREQGLDVRYLVAGETHPKVRAREGERYREALQAQARARGVADLVDFDAAYRTWPALQAIVRSASLVLLPYDSRDQVTSGVLVEALAAGKAVVATAFPHAVELSRTGAVAVVDHQSPHQCARTIRRILIHPDLQEMMATASRAEGARYDWAIVGQQFANLADEALRLAVPALTI